MNYELIVQPEAEADLTDIYSWYETQQSGLGEQFLQAVDDCLQSIQKNPLAYRAIHKQIRRALLKKFPYGIFYLIEVDRIIILACFHARRDLKRWKRSL